MFLLFNLGGVIIIIIFFLLFFLCFLIHHHLFLFHLCDLLLNLYNFLLLLLALMFGVQESPSLLAYFKCPGVFHLKEFMLKGARGWCLENIPHAWINSIPDSPCHPDQVPLAQIQKQYGMYSFQGNCWLGRCISNLPDQQLFWKCVLFYYCNWITVINYFNQPYDSNFMKIKLQL